MFVVALKTKVRYYIMGYNSFPVVRGRGMVKWNPFASIPEQYEEIHRMFEEQYKVPKPF